MLSFCEIIKTSEAYQR